MSDTLRTPPADAIDAATTLGAVRLTVSSVDRSRAFYEDALGLRASELDDGGVTFSTEVGQPLIEVRGDRSAPALDRRATGLYHLAILVPSRLDLAVALARLAEARWPLDGASDHLVSDALYLSDPDGNGIEIYRDRPREQWRYDRGQLQMATLPLDLHDLLGELRGASKLPRQMPSGTRIGHVHLQVSELTETERFYHDVLGFDVVVRTYPGALFVSAGGYHHHIGLNTWRSAGSSAPPQGSIGLRHFDVALPDAHALEHVLHRVHAAGLEIEPAATGSIVRDPSGNGLLLRAA